MFVKLAKQIKPPTESQERLFAAVIFALCLALGLFILFTQGKTIFFWVFDLLTFWGLFGMIYPWLVYPLYYAFSFIGLVIGTINTTLILFLIFFLVFSPMALIQRRSGKDPLDRRLDRRASSYWRPAAVANDPASYEKQF